MLRKYFTYIWADAEKQYWQKILSLVEEKKDGKMLDLGCDNGSLTVQLARKMKAKKGNIYGIDIIKERYKHAQQKGIVVKHANLNEKFPFKNGELDFVHANQVIEHMWDLDMFVGEIKRVLKKGGYAIICTENIASWHNIAAVLCGFQPFSVTNISFKGAIGNPLALHSHMPEGMDKDAWKRSQGAWHHTRVLAWLALKEIFKKHGFGIDSYTGYGYFPTPPFLANILGMIDPRHTAFPVLKVRKV